MNILIVVGLVIALTALIRDYQTRNLIDHPARVVAVRVCRADNHRWAAYLTTAQTLADRRSVGETAQDFHARQSRSDQIIAAIRKSVTVNCERVFG